MSLASTLTDTKARLDALLEYANEKTGQSDVSIGDAIKTLTDLIGQGGGGNVVTGTFTVPSATDTYVFDCGVDNPKFLFIYAETETVPTNVYPERTATGWYIYPSGVYGLYGANANQTTRNVFHNQGYAGGTIPVCSVDGSTVTLKTYNQSMFLIQPDITYRWYALSDAGGSGGDSVGLQNATYTDYQITEDKDDIISWCRLFLDDDLQDGAEQNHSFYVEIVGDRSEYLSAEYKFLNAMIYRSATVTDGYTVNAYYFRNGAYGIQSCLTYKLDATFVRNVKIKAGETMRVWKIVV